MDITEGIRFASAASGLIALYTGRSVRNILWYYVLLSFSADIAGYISDFYFDHKQGYGNFFILFEFLLIGVFLSQDVVPLAIKKITSVFVVCIGYGFFVATAYTKWTEINFVGAAVLYGVIIPVILSGFYAIVNDAELVRLDKSPEFIFCSAFLVYFSGSFLIMLYAGPLKGSNQVLLDNLWALHNLLNLIKNLSAAYCLFLYKIYRT
jgi:hypothetical protein